MALRSIRGTPAQQNEKQPPASLPTAVLMQPNAAYFGYLNSGAAFSASLVVFIDASHLLFFSS